MMPFILLSQFSTPIGNMPICSVPEVHRPRCGNCGNNAGVYLEGVGLRSVERLWPLMVISAVSVPGCRASPRRGFFRNKLV